MIVAAIEQRRWRLDTNRVLRAKLTDDAAKQLMQENVVPAFRQKQYAKGLGRALAAIELAATRNRVVETGPAGTFQNTGAFSRTEPMFETPAVLGGVYLVLMALLGFVALIALLTAVGNQSPGRHSQGWGFGSSFMNNDSSSTSSSFNDNSSHCDNSSSSAASFDSGGGGGGSSDAGGGASGSW